MYCESTRSNNEVSKNKIAHTHAKSAQIKPNKKKAFECKRHAGQIACLLAFYAPYNIPKTKPNSTKAKFFRSFPLTLFHIVIAVLLLPYPAQPFPNSTSHLHLSHFRSLSPSPCTILPIAIPLLISSTLRLLSLLSPSAPTSSASSTFILTAPSSLSTVCCHSPSTPVSRPSSLPPAFLSRCGSCCD